MKSTTSPDGKNHQNHCNGKSSDDSTAVSTSNSPAAANRMLWKQLSLRTMFWEHMKAASPSSTRFLMASRRWNDKQKARILVDIEDHIHAQEEAREDMAKLIDYEKLFLATRLEAHNTIGVSICMKKLLKFEARKKQADTMIQDLRAIACELQSEDEDNDSWLDADSYRARIKAVMDSPAPCYCFAPVQTKEEERDLLEQAKLQLASSAEKQSLQQVTPRAA